MSAEPVAKHVKRVFEQPPDAITCYAELTQTIVTDHEIILQFYEPIPAPPTGPLNEPEVMRSKLRATVILNRPHAAKLAATLLQVSSARVIGPSITNPPAGAE